jgi:hypothetical protein
LDSSLRVPTGDAAGITGYVTVMAQVVAEAVHDLAVNGATQARRSTRTSRNRVVADWMREEADAGANDGVDPNDDWADLEDFIVD